MAGPKAEALRLRLHAALHEHLTGLSGIVTRSAKCWQMGLRGERPVTLRDIAELATYPSREAHEAVWALIAELQDAVGPAFVCDELGEAAAAFDKEAGDVGQAMMRALRDGTVTDEEREHVRRELLEAELKALRLRLALARKTA